MLKRLSFQSLGMTLLLGMMAVGLISTMGYGFVLYKTLTLGEKNELQKTVSAVMRPVLHLASRGVNGGNVMKLRSKDSTALYKSSEIQYLLISGTSLGSPKTAFSPAFPPQPVTHEYVADGLDRARMEKLVASGFQGIDETNWLYVVRTSLPEVKNGGSVIAVFSAEMLRGSIARTLKSVGLITIGIFVITFVVAVFLERVITRPITQISAGISEISDSLDLTQRVKTKTRGEIGDTARAFNSLLDKVQPAIIKVNESITVISDTAQNLTNAVQSARQRLLDQESQSEQVATAMTEMTAVIEEVANNAQSAATSATSADQQAATGKGVVDQTVSFITKVAGEVKETSVAVQNLVEESQKIGGVIDVIKGIAEQTNLLALNAAIEAARAGEQGRGFAVVADEVRTLAGRTQNSTEEITRMIEQLQASAVAATNAMEKGSEQVNLAVNQADSAGSSLIEITGSVAAINDMNQQIAVSVNQQAKVAEEINKNVVRISDLTEQSVHASSETEHESTKLSQMSNSLRHQVSQFRI